MSALPYVWVPEWHKTGHGLHLHFAVGRFVPRGMIEQAWGHGFVHIKLLGDLPVGSGALAEARQAAGYLSKYVGKSFDDDGRIAPRGCTATRWRRASSRGRRSSGARPGRGAGAGGGRNGGAPDVFWSSARGGLAGAAGGVGAWRG